MAVDIFLKLEGIKGEASAKGYADEIEISSFSWGASNSAEAVGEPTGLEVDDIVIKKSIDRDSPALLTNCASPQVIKSGLFTFVKLTNTKSGATRPYMKVICSEM